MRLHITEDAFVGREAEQATLASLVAHHRFLQKRAALQVCLVHGAAGSGKTSLIHHSLSSSLRGSRSNKAKKQNQQQPQHQQQQQNGGSSSCCSGSYYFISGKCDQNQVFSSPYGEIVTAFDQLVTLAAPPERIQQCITTEARILTRLIPSFRRDLQLDTTTAVEKENVDNNPNDAGGVSKMSNDENPQGDYNADHDDSVSGRSADGDNSLTLASERLIVAFRVFLREFCSPDHPIVLFIDDLQWCDENSCRLLAQIVNDESIHNFLFIGCYRDELESNVNVNFLHHIDTSRSTFTDVPLGRLNASDVDRLVGMVLDTTSSSSSDHNNQLSRGISNVSSVSSRNIDDSGDLDSCSQLTQLVHRKTLGNPYFVVQFLEMLHARELLTYNYITMKWTWRLSEIAANTSVASNVVDVVTERIARLAPQVQRILIVAAFLGFVVNVQLLEHLIQEFGVMDRLRILQEQDGEQLLESELTTAEALKLASIEGLIELSGPNICRFSHDKVQESFCALVPAKKEQDRLHYQIGMNIWQRYRETDPAFIFLAADQLNRGAGHVVHDADRLFLIEINYKASLAAKSKVGIDTVGMFIEKAIEHASVNSTGYWEKSYELLVNVYSFGAEVECSRGAFNKSEEYSNTILRFSKHTNDTIRALVPRALAHGVKRDFLLGIKESRKILKLLGVKMLPSSTFGFLTEVLRTKSALKKKTDGDILGMKNMESDNMIRAMKILQHGSIFGWNSDTTFAGLCYFKMIRLTVEHGWCVVTPYALSGYGFLLASLGSEQEAFRFSQLALHSTKSRTAQPDVNMMVHTFLAHFQRPASQSLQPLLAGYRSGLETGDMMCGTICMCCYAHVYLFCGLPLKSFSLDMQQFAQQLKLCHQDLALAFLLPALQLALNLSGATADPMDVSRESMERDLDAYNDKMFTDTAVEDPSLLFVFYLQAFSAYLLDDLDLAERALERVFARQKKRLAGTQILNIFFTLVDGLVGFAFCRRKPTYKYRKLTRASIKELENLTKRQSINCVGIMCLLQAENASYGGQGTELVKEKYNSAIRQLSRGGFLHYAAIANELAGLHMLRIKDEYWAKHYLGNSAASYAEWGAVVKAKQMAKKHDSVVFLHDEAPSGAFIHGREQYDGNVDSIRRTPSKSGDSSELFGTLPYHSTKLPEPATS